MFKFRHVYRDEAGEAEGSSSDEWESPPGETEAEEPETPATYLRDLTEDDVYERLSKVTQYPDQMRALESRLFGSMGPMTERMQKLEKSLSTQVGFDSEKLEKALRDYDPVLAEKLVPALVEALRVNPLDETSLSPHLSPMRDNMQSWMGEQLVLSVYDPEEIGAIIPDVADGKWTPTTQRHKDFIDWFALQGLQTQQSLQTFGAGYVKALRKFEGWEQGKIKERQKAAGATSSRLAGGQTPSSQGRRGTKKSYSTPEEAFLAGFNEVD